jgi:hypothetical protein
VNAEAKIVRQEFGGDLSWVQLDFVEGEWVADAFVAAADRAGAAAGGAD